MRPWVLADVNYGQVKHRPFEVAVLPLGATEPHNLHLPYGTDTLEGEAIAERACAAAHQQGARVVMLPAIPYGTETNLQKFPLAMNLLPSTLTLVLRDLIQSLANSGIRKLVLVNSHGGNDLKPMLREFYGSTPVHIFLCEWYRALTADQRAIFSAADDHAGEMETSVILALAPDLVAHNPETGRLTADDGQVARSRFAAVNDGWVTITRPWHLLTTNSGSGNPHQATADKGRQLLQVAVQRLAAFLVELAAATIDETFPY